MASGRPLDPAALLPVASVGKAMTSTALLRAAVLGHEAPPAPPPAVAEPPAAAPRPGPAATDLPADLAPLVGTYAAFNPWLPEVLVRPDAAGTGLVLYLPGEDGAPLAPRADGGFRPGGRLRLAVRPGRPVTELPGRTGT